MASGETKSGSGFTVTDRRSFSDSGEARPDEPSPPVARESPDDFPTAAFPPVDFHTFVLSLGSSALLHLGELESPEAGAPQKDLALAKHTIDILAMLEEKTKGNLTGDEERLIGQILFDLRMRYVERSKMK